MKRGLAALGLAVSALAACVASSARAQDEVVLVCDGACAALDLDRVGARVCEETATVVRVAVEPGAAPVILFVSVAADSRVAIRLARRDGSTMERTAELPPERPEQAETIAILAVNMLRDEASELLALLRRPAEPEASEAPPVEPALGVEASEVSSVPAADPVVPLAPPVEVEEPATPRDPFMRFGLSAHLGSVAQGIGGFETDFLAGLEVAWTPTPFLAFGMREIGPGSDLRGSAWHVGAAPFAELGLVLSFVTLYADLGVNVQVVMDDDFQGDPTVGAAPLLTAGVRARLAREVSLGLESTIHVVATDSFYTSIHQLPQLAVSWTGGISLLFHVS